MAYFDVAKFDEAWFDCIDKVPLFRKVLASFKRVGKNFTLTWKKRLRSGVDTQTGKPVFTFQAVDIEAVVREATSGHLWVEPGLAPTKTIIVYAMEGIRVFDRFEWRGEEFEVVSPPREVWFGMRFFCRICIAERLKYGE